MALLGQLRASRGIGADGCDGAAGADGAGRSAGADGAGRSAGADGSGGADGSAGAAGGEAADPAPAPPIVGRRGLLAVAAAAILIALQLGAQVHGAGGIVVVAAGLVALAIVSRALLPPGTLRLRGQAQRLVVLRAGLGATATATDVHLTLHLQSERGLSPTAAGLIIAAGAGGWAIGSWLQAQAGSSAGRHRTLILLATPLVALSPLVVLLLVLDLVPIPVVVAAAVLKGLGMGIASARIATATLDLAPPGEQGAYSSALQTGESLAVSSTTAVMAVILGGALGGIVPAITGTGAYAAVYALLTAGAIVTIAIAATGRGTAARTGGRQDRPTGARR